MMGVRVMDDVSQEACVWETPTVSRSPRSALARLRSTKLRSRAFVGAVVAVLTGCMDTPGTGIEDSRSVAASLELAQTLADSERERASQGRRERGPEDEILRLEAEVPGIGGFFVDPETRRLVVYSQATASDVRSVEAAQAMLQRLDIAGDISGVEVRRGQFAFSSLVAWQKMLRGSLLDIPDVVAIDADERRNRVHVRVTSETARSRVFGIAQEWLGVLAAVEVSLSSRPTSLASLTSKFRPAGGGLLIKPSLGGSDCTLGWPVTTNQGEKGFLTASHCIGYGGGSTGAQMSQPSGVSNGIGTIELNDDWDLTTCDDPDSSGYYNGDCTRADVMFVETNHVSKRIAFSTQMGANNNHGSTTFNTFRSDIGTVPTVIVGQVLDKVGHVTGWTRGDLEATCEDVLVEIPTEYLVLCGYRVEKAAAATGDSGSPVFINSSDLRPTGILFAGLCPSGEDCFYYYSEWDNIRLHLGRTFDPSTPTPALAAHMTGPSSVKPGTTCTWSVTPTGGDSPYAYSWSGVTSGTGSQVSANIGGSGWLKLTVTDDGMGVAHDSLFVTRTSSNPECGGGGGGPEEVGARNRGPGGK